jgi:hypothetical protein
MLAKRNHPHLMGDMVWTSRSFFPQVCTPLIPYRERVLCVGSQRQHVVPDNECIIGFNLATWLTLICAERRGLIHVRDHSGRKIKRIEGLSQREQVAGKVHKVVNGQAH